MRYVRIIFLAAVLLGLPLVSLAAAVGERHDPKAAEAAAKVETHVEGAADAHAAPSADHSLPMQAPRLLGDGSDSQFQITNSLVAMFVVSALLIVFAQLATRKTTLVPAGLQNFAEWIVESLITFLSGIMGEKLARKTFWFYATVFILILFSNWFGLLPGVGSIGWGYETEHGFHVSRPILRGANADLNMTLALAVTFFVLWLFWSIRSNGPGGFLAHIFLYRGEATGPMKALLLLIFFLVGFLEVISIMIRPVSLTFRLYGNIYAGESLLEKMLHMGGPMFGWLAALPFFGLELMVGLIQALVFMLLTAVFTALMCHHDDEHHAEEGHGHGHDEKQHGH
jgi:F-type H+-transporting ATPase subunit a